MDDSIKFIDFFSGVGSRDSNGYTMGRVRGVHSFVSLS